MATELLSNLVITKVYSVSTVYTLKNAKLRKIVRPRWAVVLKYEGETVYHSNGKSYLSDLSHMVILPKGCTYDWECTKPGHFYIIEFECEKTFVEPFGFSVKNGERILKMFKDLDLNDNKNLFVVSAILIAGIGGLTIQIPYALTEGGAVAKTIQVTSIATALILGIVTNFILSKFDKKEEN